jgi:hypothetical protein
MPQVLPFQPSLPNYRFSTSLGDTTYRFNVRWNSRDEAWYFDLSDDEGDLIVTGVKIVLGALLVARSADDRIPNGALLAGDTSNTGIDATLDDLGVRVFVYFYSPDELEEIEV